jgi:hypothetical protein
MPLKFTTGGKTYTAASLTRPSIRDFMNLAKITEALGEKLTSADVFRIEAEIEACQSAEERTARADFLTFLGLIVWATLIDEGEPDPYNRAIDISLDDLVFFYEDEPVAADPSKARTRAASARAVKRPAAKRASARTTSRAKSSPAS